MKYDRHEILVEDKRSPEIVGMLIRNKDCVSVEYLEADQDETLLGVDTRPSTLSEVDFLALPGVLEAVKVCGVVSIGNLPKVFLVTTEPGKGDRIVSMLLEADSEALFMLDQRTYDHFRLVSTVFTKDGLLGLRGVRYVKEVATNA